MKLLFSNGPVSDGQDLVLVKGQTVGIGMHYARGSTSAVIQEAEKSAAGISDTFAFWIVALLLAIF